MHLDLLPRQCVSCPAKPPACACSADQNCIQISQSCNACPTFTCQPTSSSSSGNGGISSGALGGAIAAVLLVLIGALVVFFLYRRRQRARQSRDAAIEAKADVPAPAEAVLNRPDPIEKMEKPQPPQTTSAPANTVRVYSSLGDSVIDLDPRSQGSLTPTARRASGRPSTGNPFDDGQSIQTTSTSTNGTNVIPIALVSPGSVQPSSPHSESLSFPPNHPARPARPTEDLVIDSPQPSLDTLREPSPHYARSQRSDLSRMSCASNASYSSDFLNEAPMIVTHTQSAVRQVVGKARAEVIQTSGTVTPSSSLSSDGLKLPSSISRPSIRSPLAATSFGPADIVGEADEEHQFSPRSTHSDPFGDHHTPSKQPSIVPIDSRARADLDEPVPPVQFLSDGNNTRINNGLPSSDQKLPHSSPMVKMTPPSATPGTLQEQQQRALAHAQAQARAQGLDKFKRMSGTSMVSTTSTRADSILESFPFVPPSPISSRPVRSPPRSPLGQQFSAPTQSQAPSAVAQSFTSHLMSPETGTTQAEVSLPPLDPPPSRRILGMSTGSQLSTASSGLGNFPFQIDHGGTEATHPPSASQARQRASLDTLVLMSDLSSYPLGYDRDVHDSLPTLPKG